jgi:hypothetical protein
VAGEAGLVQRLVARPSALKVSKPQPVLGRVAGEITTGEAGPVQRLVAWLSALKSANPQPPVAAYFFESLTMN